MYISIAIAISVLVYIAQLHTVYMDYYNARYTKLPT